MEMPGINEDCVIFTVHTYNGTGALELICDYSKEDFNWRLVKGLNFKRENQKYVVATLSITNCAIPPESDVRNDNKVLLFH